MAEPRKRRIVRWVVAACAVAAALSVVAVGLRDPSDIKRSRAIRIGMTEAEVETAMGRLGTSIPAVSDGRWLLYGELGDAKHLFRVNVDNWFGYKFQPAHMADTWPVRIKLDENDRVDRVERGYRTP